MGEEQRDSGTEGVKKQSLRPALIASANTVSEYSIFLRHLLVGLADESIPTALVWPSACNMGSVIPPSVEVIRHPAFNFPLFWRENRSRLIEQLANFKPSVLHCLCESKAPLARRLAWELDLPYVLTVNSLQRRFGRPFVSSARCAKIITPAKSVAANLAKVYPRLAGRIERVNVGTFVDKSRACFCEPEGIVSMVTAQPFENVSAFENLFKAVKHLVIDGYEILFVVIGGGRAERGLWKLLRSLGLLWIVTVIPRLEPWRSVLAAGDIFIQPVANSSFSPFLLEAMSAGTVVAGCKGGVDDLIIEDKTAVVFDPDDELSIKRSLQRLFDRREWAQQIAEDAQEYLRKNHTVTNMISSLLQIYCDAQQ
ncbi:MAG: glycosyltransferase family 4 protein [Planctomycetota bacterium]|jgi:glycosyltransferase involved in cell wall biosynthesis